MLNRVLMEIECPPAKGPPPNTPPKQANPVELKRCLAAIATRRKNLVSAHEKLSELAGKGTGSAAYECQKLRVKSAEAWLNFTVTRWKMLSEFSKTHGKKHPETDKLLGFGDVHAGHAEHHLKVAGTGEPHHPIADVEFNHEKGQLYHAGVDHPFELPEDPHAEVKPPAGAKKKAPGIEEPEEPEEKPAKAPESHAAKPTAPKSVAPPPVTPPPSTAEPEEPVHELPAHSKAEIMGVLKHVKHGDLAKIQSVLADHGVENPSPRLLKKLSKELAPKPHTPPDDVDAPGPSGELPWPYKDYTTVTEKAKIAGLAKMHATGGKFDADGDPTPETVKQFKIALDQVSLPLKHLDAVAQLKDAHQSIKKPAPMPGVAPLEPVAPKASWGTLAPAQKVDVANQVKAALIARSKAAGTVSALDPEEAAKILKSAGIEHPTPADLSTVMGVGDSALATLYANHTPEDTAKLATKASDIIHEMAKGASDGVSLSSAAVALGLMKAAHDTTGKLLKTGDAVDIAKSAIEKFKSPKPLEDYSEEQQAKITNKAHGLAVQLASKGQDYATYRAALGTHLAEAGLGLSDAALGKIAIHTWDTSAHQTWAGLSDGQKSMAVAVVKAALEKKQDPATALAGVSGHGLPHLKPETVQQIINDLSTGDKAADQVPALSSLKAQVFAHWDQLVKSQPANEWKFIDSARKNVLAQAFPEHIPFATTYGLGKEDWLLDTWVEWNWDEALTPKEPEKKEEAKTPSATASAHLVGWSHFKKIGTWNKLTQHQKAYLDEKIDAALASGAHTLSNGELSEKKMAGLAKKIHGEFKDDWSTKGVTQLNLDVVKKRLEDKAVDAHGTAKPASTDKDPPAAQPEDYLAMLAAAPPGTLNEYGAAAFKDIATKVFVQKKWNGNFASPSQQKYFKDMLATVKKALPATPEAPAPEPAAAQPTPAPVPEITKDTPADENPLGKSVAELEKAAQLEKPPTVGHDKGDPPELSSAVWKGKAAFGLGGAHDKQAVATDEEGFPLKSKTLKTGATHAWMYKVDKVIPGVAYGEVAATRIQGLLGLGKTDRIWVEKDPQGLPGVMQHFEAQSDFRKLGDKTPWLDNPQKDKIARQLQQYMVSNWLVDERDDHDGNFVMDKNGVVTAVDHGQAGKFFDSSQTLLSNLDWEPPSGVFQDPDKGFPKRMLKDWAAGKAVPLMPLTDSDFEGVVAKAEAIPSETYKKMWTPYAEGLAASKLGKPAGFSTVASDQTVAGFVTALDDRRKNIRSQVGDLFAHLAKTRAQALKDTGDGRALSAIEAEVRDQIGLDEFLQGKHVVAKVNPKIVAKAKAEAADAAGEVPTTSQFPHHEALAKSGFQGLDMMVGGKDVKDGRIQFYQLGKNPMATMMLEPWARDKLEARLPGGGGAGPVQPSAPEVPDFEPPPKPTFNETGADFHKKILAAGGNTSDKKKADGTPLSKIEKHIDKWKKGAFEEGGNQYLDKGYKVAQAMAKSADPVEKAAGEHYVTEFDKVGSVESGTFKMKDPNTVPADVRAALVPEFKPTKAMLDAQKKAKENVETAHAKAVASAKTNWEESKKKIEADHEKALEKWKIAKKAFDDEAASAGKLPATQLDYYPVPDADPDSDPVKGEGKITNSSTFDGKYEKPWDENANPMKSWEIDLTDAVTGVAAAGGKAATTKKLIVHYVPSLKNGTDPNAARKYASRGGQLRIQFPAGSTKEQMEDYTKAIGKMIGSEFRPATKKEHELTYLRRMAWLRRIEGYKVGSVNLSSEPDGTLDEKIEWWVDQFKKPPSTSDYGGGLGHDPRYEPERTTTGKPKMTGGQVVLKKNPDGSFVKNPHYKPEAVDSGAGRLAFHRFDVSTDEMKKWMDEGLTLFKSSLTGDGQNLQAMINAGGVFATEKRANIGIMGKSKPATGMSSSADVSTGGSNEVFLYISRSSARDNGWAHFDPRIMLYTSAWHHAGDHYGAKSGSEAAGRTGTVQEGDISEAVAHASSAQNEVLVGDRVPFWNWVTRINASKQGLNAKDVIAKLKAAGITHAGPDKTPIEKVIV